MPVDEVLTRGDVAAVRALAAAADAAGRHPMLDEDRLARATAPAATAPTDAAPTDTAPPAATALVRDAGGRPSAFAQAVPGRGRWDLDLVIGPGPAGEEAAAAVLTRVAAAVAGRGGGPSYLWLSRPTAAEEAVVATAGFRPDRDLWQMRRPLPTGLDFDLATRPFVPGRDEAAWVEVNNRAFAWHPEQGGWTVDDVRAHEAEPWFDPAGFLLHEAGGRLAGFCWTKVHPDHDPPLGEIYVIATDPGRHRRGLGRALTLAGLDHLASAGLTVGMLYVDAGNTPAVKLYEAIGFTTHHVDRAYAADIPERPA